ncbi:MAG: glycoside hydrolase family 16 protein [Ignavibacteriales bacterium]|nr:glycoside hydrolase family 16 protein [Ignavibacteriales bacterium]
MRTNVIIISFSLVLLLISCKKDTIVQTEYNSDGYNLVWSDEFDEDGQPDPKNWGYEIGFIRNQELQYYKPSNASCENGFLIIEAKRDSIINPKYKPGSSKWQEQRKYSEYTSASLHTQNRKSFKFGRIEIRAKIDIGAGLWPAFWTQGVSGGWPYNGEVDVMEYYQEKILANFAWGAAQSGKAIWDSYRKPVSELGGEEWAKNFHIWRMDWDSTQIRISLDDLLLNSVDLSETINKDAAGKNPFLQPHYLIINLAIGGTAGGDPKPTPFPVFYVIDYVRVYQKL